MRATVPFGRIIRQATAQTLHAAGYPRSPRYIRAVLSGEKRSRSALREISAAIDAIRQRDASDRPDWLVAFPVESLYSSVARLTVSITAGSSRICPWV